MHLDRADLQLLVFAARRTACALRAEESTHTLWVRTNAPALECLATRLEDELAHRESEPPLAAGSR